jgi:hypothetical protein
MYYFPTFCEAQKFKKKSFGRTESLNKEAEMKIESINYFHEISIKIKHGLNATYNQLS